LQRGEPEEAADQLEPNGQGDRDEYDDLLDRELDAMD
jgi:hypothetical protein